MRGSSKLISLGDLERDGSILQIQDGNHGEKHPKASDYADDGVPFIMANNVVNNRVDLENAAKIPTALAEKLRIGFSIKGDVLLTHKGTIGNVAIVDTDLPYLMLTPQVTYYRTDEAKLRPRYLLYAFREMLFQKTMKSLAQQATRPYIGITAQRRLKIRWKSPTEQDRLIGFLSQYDDLIENNRRRIQLLEQAARLLYKEWFVHLRFPGHEHVKITQGVPEGWDHGVVSDFYHTASGGTPSRKNPEYFTGEISWVKTQELPNGFILETGEHITEDAVSNSAAKIFPKNTILLALYGATIGELGILSKDATCNQACCAVMRKDDRSHYVHAYLFFRENKKNLVSLSGGSAQNNISQQIVRGFPMTMPAATLTGMFVEAVQPAFDQWLNLERQNLALKTARDLLLPRLMNGEIPV